LLGDDPQTAAGRARLSGRVAYVSADPASQLSGIAETVLDEVAFAPANLGWPRERIHESANDAMHRLGVSHLSARSPASLSGGEQQRVVLASMLALAPGAWLLDEPGSALDALGRQTLAAILVAEARRGALVLVASEDADWVAAWADRLVVLRAGRIMRDGIPADLLADPALAETGAATTAAATFARALAARDPAFASDRYPVTVAEAVGRWA
jgi:energy-coupling factor transporter ATP-binding protein EcfA2